MCAVCTLWELGKLRKDEVELAFLELIRSQIVDFEHMAKVREVIERSKDEKNP